MLKCVVTWYQVRLYCSFASWSLSPVLVSSGQVMTPDLRDNFFQNNFHQNDRTKHSERFARCRKAMLHTSVVEEMLLTGFDWMQQINERHLNLGSFLLGASGSVRARVYNLVESHPSQLIEVGRFCTCGWKNEKKL